MQGFIKLTIVFLISLTLANNSFADTDLTKRSEVQAFINSMVKKHHFKKKYLNNLFSQVKIRPQVIRHVKKPLEKESWHLYQVLFVSKWRIENGVKYWEKHAKTLAKAEKIYGVPASIIVATIGVESKYGQVIGKFRVIDSLSSIGFSESPRAAFFRKELEQFLLLTRENKLNPLKVMGSYAGAIGQPQFMPSSYRNHAINFSKSGKIDLMHNEIDVIGSIANYYKKHGWMTHAPIAVRAATIGERYNYFMRRDKQIKQALPLKDLAKYGVIAQSRLISDEEKAKVVELKSHYSTEYWLGFHNFDVIKRYNASDSVSYTHLTLPTNREV